MREYSINPLPQFVLHWLGGRYSDISMWRLSDDVWMACGTRRALIVRSRCPDSARLLMRRVVSLDSPVTDRRRMYWVYT